MAGPHLMIFSIQYIQYPFSHLRDISRSSKYIRYVIIDWLMTRKLDVNLLTVNLLTGGGSLTYYKPVVNRKRAGKSHNFDISMVQDYVIKVNGLRVQGNNLRLRLTMKNGREVSKGFSCNSLGKDDLEALAEIQDYLVAAQAAPSRGISTPLLPVSSDTPPCQ